MDAPFDLIPFISNDPIGLTDQSVEELPRKTLSLAAQLRSKRSRAPTLNKLLEQTSNYELSYTLENEEALQALTEIFFESVGRKRDRLEKDAKPKFLAQGAWTVHTASNSLEWATYCRQQLMKGKLGMETLRVVEAVLAILRNLSFVASNHRLLALSTDVIDILVGSLYEQTSIGVGISEDNSTNMNTSAIATHALQALVNLAPYFDITGQKLLCDKLFLVVGSDDFPNIPSPKSWGKGLGFGFGSLWLAKKLDAREDQISDVPDDLVVELTEQYLVCIWALFPAVLKVFSDPTSPRLLLMMAVDFLQEMLAHARGSAMGQFDASHGKYPTARSVLLNIPDVILRRLVDLLYTPRLGSDSMEYVDPTNCIVTRVNTLRMLLGYDAAVDTDLRDRSLDVLVLLLELDPPTMANRLVNLIPRRVHTRLFDGLLPILTSQVGRSEAPTLATQLVKELSKADFSMPASRVYIHGRLTLLGSTDDKIAHLALNFI